MPTKAPLTACANRSSWRERGNALIPSPYKGANTFLLSSGD